MSASPLLAAQNWDGSRKNPILSRTINLQNLRGDSTTLAPQVPSSVSPKHLTIPASSEYLKVSCFWAVLAFSEGTSSQLLHPQTMNCWERLTESRKWIQYVRKGEGTCSGYICARMSVCMCMKTGWSWQTMSTMYVKTTMTSKTHSLFYLKSNQSKKLDFKNSLLAHFLVFCLFFLRTEQLFIIKHSSVREKP